MQNIKIAPTFFIIKNVVKIKNVKKRKNRDINKKRKKTFFYIYGCFGAELTRVSFSSNICNVIRYITIITEFRSCSVAENADSLRRDHYGSY